jgi:outer membrane protein TolC
MKNKISFTYYVTIAAFLISLFVSRACTADVQTPISLSLDEAVKTALDNNPMLAAARGDASAAAARVSMSASQQKPALSTTAFLADGDMPGILNGPASIMPAASNAYFSKRYYDQNLMLMYPLDVSRRLKKNTRGDAHLSTAATADYERTRQDLIQQIRAMYYEIKYQDARTQTYKAALEVSQEQLKIDESAVTSGKIPAYYLDRDRAELAMSEQALAESQRDADTMRIQFSAMLGQDPSTALQLTTPLEKPGQDFPEQSPPSDRLPEFAAARARADAAVSSLESAKRSSKPDVSVVLMTDRVASQDNETMNGTTAAIVAAFPLFDGGMRRATKKEARAMKSASENEMKSADLNVKAAYQSARLEYATALAGIASSDKALASAEENFRVAKIRYEAGKSILVEMLDAKSALTTARVSRVQAIRDSLVARDKLLRFSGAFSNSPNH